MTNVSSRVNGPGGSSNPRAHKIVETSSGREYIPDTNSNNIVNLEVRTFNNTNNM